MNAKQRDLRAFLDVIYHVALFVRAQSSGKNRLPDDHLFDLMDAIHNVPVMLTQDDPYFNAEMIRDVYFARYDSKWGSNGLGLVGLLNNAYQRIDAN